MKGSGGDWLPEGSGGDWMPGPGMGTGAFSSFHMEKGMPKPLIDQAALPNSATYKNIIMGFFIEARRRLPEIPELVDCVCWGCANCIGLADPVTNVILNAVGLLVHKEDSLPLQPKWPPEPRWVPGAPSPSTWTPAAAAHHSYKGLLAFMTTYFRYLSNAQARRYLHLASYDLSLAIELVHYDRRSDQTPRRRMLPDGGRTKRALRVAARRGDHPEPDVLARLMTAGYPPDLFADVMGRLRGTEEVLSSADVSKIKTLLASQWPPACPPVNIEFWSPPSQRCANFSSEGTTLLRLQTCIGECRTQVIIIHGEDHEHFKYLHISDLEQRGSDRDQLTRCLDRATMCVPPNPIIDSDAASSSPCEHMMSLKLCLGDTIHVFFIKALAVMPLGIRLTHLLHALLMAGHCYGYFDPVTNIIVNTIWYGVNFPFSDPCDDKFPEGILDGRIIGRLASRSLNGLVAIARSAAMLSDHQALKLLNSCNCNITGSGHIKICEDTFLHAAKAANHPQYAAFGSFFGRYDCERARHLLSLLGERDGGGRIPSDSWLEACTKLRTSFTLSSDDQVPEEKPCLSLSASLTMSREQRAAKSKVIFLRCKMEELLYKYRCQHPWEPEFQVGIICGVVEFTPPCLPKHYHVNFLASVADGEQTLFFAELMDSHLSEVESKSSRCSPVYDYRDTGRCSICEEGLSRILHPPSGGYRGDIDHSTPDLYRPDVHKFHEDDFEGLLGEDYIYFELHRDAEVAKIINNVHSYGHPWT